MNSCQRSTLARNELSSLESCSCGAVHFNLGPLTLRLDPSAVFELAQVFGAAASALPKATQNAASAQRN